MQRRLTVVQRVIYSPSADADISSAGNYIPAMVTHIYSTASYNPSATGNRRSMTPYYRSTGAYIGSIGM